MPNFAFRNLYDGEPCDNGLVAKNPDDTKYTLSQHVLNGNLDSRFISATWSLAVTLKYNDKNEGHKPSKVAIIDLDKLEKLPLNCAHHGEWAKRAYYFGTASQEIAFEKEVPAEAVQILFDEKDFDKMSESPNIDDHNALQKLCKIIKENGELDYSRKICRMDSFIRFDTFMPEITLSIREKSDELKDYAEIMSNLYYVLDKASPILLQNGDLETLRAGFIALGKYNNEMIKTFTHDLGITIDNIPDIRVVEIPDGRYRNVQRESLPKNDLRLALDTAEAKKNLDELEYKIEHPTDKNKQLIDYVKKEAEKYFSEELGTPVIDNIVNGHHGITAVKGDPLYMKLLVTTFGGEIYGDGNKWIGHASSQEVEKLLSEAFDTESRLNDASEAFVMKETDETLEAYILAEEKYDSIFTDAVKGYAARTAEITSR